MRCGTCCRALDWSRKTSLPFASLLLAAALPAVTLNPETQRLSHDILKQLVEINTTDSVGSTTVAAQAMAKRLLDAGFPAADVTVLGPNERKGNVVARFRGANT